MTASLASFPQNGFSAPKGSKEWELEILEAARRKGRALRRAETNTDQIIWSGARTHGTGPMFLTRRIALTWMANLIERAETHHL